MRSGGACCDVNWHRWSDLIKTPSAATVAVRSSCTARRRMAVERSQHAWLATPRQLGAVAPDDQYCADHSDTVGCFRVTPVMDRPLPRTSATRRAVTLRPELHDNDVISAS